MKINLDSFTLDQLEGFAYYLQNHPRSSARKYFPGENGNVATIKNLAHYCWNKATSIRCKDDHQFTRGLMYDQICEKIYENLPDYAKWRE